MRTIKSGPVLLNYHIVGKGDLTLLFVHGAYIDQSYWAEQVKYFSPKYRVVTFDLPGHGGSGRNRNDWTVAQFRKDLVAWMDQLDLKT